MTNTRQANFDQKHFRQALGRFATGVTIVTTTHPETKEPIGLTVSSFNSVSMDPPYVLWCLRFESRNLPVFEKVSHYNIHIMAADQIELAKHFATVPPEERFKQLDYSMTEVGVPLLDPSYCSAWFECHNKIQHEEGDHIILIGEVERCDYTDKTPLVFHAGSFDLTPDYLTL